MKFVEILKEILTFACRMAIMPIIIFKKSRSLIREAYESEKRIAAFSSHEFNLRSFGKSVATVVLFSLFWTSLWAVVAYLALPSLWFALLWTISWTSGWGNTAWSIIYLAVALASVALAAWQFWVEIPKLEKNINLLECELEYNRNNLRKRTDEHLCVTAGLEVLRKLGKDPRRKQSPVAREIMAEIEMILGTVPYEGINSDSIQHQECWKRKFNVDERIRKRA